MAGSKGALRAVLGLISIVLVLAACSLGGTTGGGTSPTATPGTPTATPLPPCATRPTTTGTVWIDQDTKRMVKAVVNSPQSGSTPASTITLDMTDFNAAVDVSAPV